MKHNLIFLICVLSLSAFATESCPNNDEWHGLKYRAFTNKLFITVSHCGREVPGISDRYNQFLQKMESLQSGYYEQQMNKASAFYDRTGRQAHNADNSDNRPDRYRAESGRNLQWDTEETRNLNMLELQRINNMNNLSSDCAQASSLLNQLNSVSSIAEMDNICLNHAFAQETNLPDCAPDSAINTQAQSSPAAAPQASPPPQDGLAAAPVVPAPPPPAARVDSAPIVSSGGDIAVPDSTIRRATGMPTPLIPTRIVSPVRAACCDQTGHIVPGGGTCDPNDNSGLAGGLDPCDN